MENPERLARLEKIVSHVCTQLVNNDRDYAWQEWAKPLREFVNEIYNETYGHEPFIDIKWEGLAKEFEQRRPKV